jgi:hypothetical protein
MFNKFSLLNIILFMSISIGLFAQPSPPSGKNWVVVPLLTDEFNGTTLDGTKWQNTHRSWAGRAPSQFLPANVSVGGGNLQLKSTVGNTNMVGNWVNSAVVQSKGRPMKAGMYSEARIKCSKLSMTTAFWFQGDYSEIDRQENLGAPSSPNWTQLANTDQINTHYFPGGFELGDKKTPKFINNLSPGVGDTYYIYGVWWKDSRNILIYLDGVQRESITLPYDFNETMFMYFDTETFTWGVGLPTVASLEDNTKNTGYIDYVRTWDLQDSPKEVLSNEEDLKEMDTKLYPMPFENEINITVSAKISAISEIKLLGLDGKIVQNLQNYTFKNKQILIETSNINVGTYILKIDTDKGVISKKVIKK